MQQMRVLQGVVVALLDFFDLRKNVDGTMQIYMMQTGVLESELLKKLSNVSPFCGIL